MLSVGYARKNIDKNINFCLLEVILNSSFYQGLTYCFSFFIVVCFVFKTVFLCV